MHHKLIRSAQFYAVVLHCQISLFTIKTITTEKGKNGEEKIWGLDTDYFQYGGSKYSQAVPARRYGEGRLEAK